MVPDRNVYDKSRNSCEIDEKGSSLHGELHTEKYSPSADRASISEGIVPETVVADKLNNSVMKQEET
jgi:hypothetical protein